MQLPRRLLQFFAHYIWARLPRVIQHGISGFHAVVYEMRWSRILIGPYAFLQYGSRSSLVFREFSPASGSKDYKNFQDFFSRRLSTPRVLESDHVWPCDGLLCESASISSDLVVVIKGEARHLRAVFGERGNEIPDGYFFANVFLHNRDYHRIHCPVASVVEWVERVPGDLRLLRPWAYQRTSPSLPALTNERVNVCLCDLQGRRWYLAIVGGPGVATISGFDHLLPGTRLACGAELAVFKMGSTCCLVSPLPIATLPHSYVRMGEPL